MRDPIRAIRNFAIYLLPASLLATAGAVLMALLYYPAPPAAPVAESRAAAVADEPHGRAEAETLFAAMLADALRQLQVEREPQARTLMYQYGNGAPSAERPALLWVAPPMIQPGDDAGRPVLIRL